jgi:hypothetical protein
MAMPATFATADKVRRITRQQGSSPNIVWLVGEQPLTACSAQRPPY